MEGDITGAHVDVMVPLRRPETEEALARDEALLVDQATELTFAQFNRVAAYWEQLADPDGADKDAERRGPAGTSTWSRASAAAGSGP